MADTTMNRACGTVVCGAAAAELMLFLMLAIDASAGAQQLPHWALLWVGAFVFTLLLGCGLFIVRGHVWGAGTAVLLTPLLLFVSPSFQGTQAWRGSILLAGFVIIIASGVVLVVSLVARYASADGMPSSAGLK